MKTFLRRLSYLLQHRRHEADLRDEIETHRMLPMAFGIVAGLLMLTGLVATAIPAHRALSVDPAVTLGHDT